MIHFLIILNLLILPILFWRQISTFAIVSGILLVHILAILLGVGIFTWVLFAFMGPLAFIVSPAAIALLWLKTRPRKIALEWADPKPIKQTEDFQKWVSDLRAKQERSQGLENWLNTERN